MVPRRGSYRDPNADSKAAGKDQFDRPKNLANKYRKFAARFDTGGYLSARPKPAENSTGVRPFTCGCSRDLELDGARPENKMLLAVKILVSRRATRKGAGFLARINNAIIAR